MPLVIADADMFAPDFHVRAVTVNRFGSMGGGIALEAARRYPGLLAVYRAACAEPYRLLPGMTWAPPGFPAVWLSVTKDHWSRPSRLAWVFACAYEIVARARERSAADGPGLRVAVPALGCGLGRLAWDDARPALARILARVPDDVHVTLIPPRDEAPRARR